MIQANPIGINKHNAILPVYLLFQTFSSVAYLDFTLHDALKNKSMKTTFLMMKFSRAISQVKWLSSEETNGSKTISVLVLRVLVY
jgi:hypothetical protein